jgi:SulP family sulfate permease
MDLKKRSLGLVINNLQPRMILKLRRAGVRKRIGMLEFSRTMGDAMTIAGSMNDREGLPGKKANAA